jgi:heptosyltransferase-1
VIEALQQNSLILWATAPEKERADWIAKRSAFARVLPKLTMNALKAVIANSDLMIGNDTGPTHMAWGFNRPSITLFGPTPVSRIYQTEINIAIKSPSKVNPLKLNKQDFSIAEIPAVVVVEQAQGLLT